MIVKPVIPVSFINRERQRGLQNRNVHEPYISQYNIERDYSEICNTSRVAPGITRENTFHPYFPFRGRILKVSFLSDICVMGEIHFPNFIFRFAGSGLMSKSVHFALLQFSN